MSKKILFLISFVLLLSLVGTASAVYYIWDNDNGAGDRSWNTPENWDPNGVPVAGDWAELEADYVDDGNGLIIDAGTDATCEWLSTGYYEYPVGGEAVVTMTGGNVNADAYILFGQTGGNHRFDISDGNVTTGGDFYLADEGTGTTGVVNMSGGTITIGEDLQIGNYDDAYGVFNMSGGRIDIVNEQQIYVGFYSTNPSIFNITGGEVHTYEFVIGNNWGDTPAGAGHLKLHGGTIYTEYFAFGGDSSVDVTDGVLIADEDLTVPNGLIFNPGVDTHSEADAGNWTGTLPILIEKGLITAYDVNHTEIVTDDVNFPAQAGLRAIISVDYDVTNPGKTTLSATTIDPNLAWNENPSSGATWQPQVITLSWSAGDNAASHEVYFGTSFSDVDDANTASDPNIYRGSQPLADVNYTVPETLAWDTTYYWRIDEVNNPTWKGSVWNFTTAPGTATDPYPADDAWYIRPDVVLHWTPGVEAVTHEVYFGTSWDDVNDANTTVDPNNVYKGPQVYGANTYDAGTLEDLLFDTYYYWRVDEVNLDADVTRWKGDVWTFWVDYYLSVDDFDSYANTEPDLVAVWDDYWVNDSGAVITLITDADFTRDGNSIMYDYDNSSKTGGQYLGSWIDADTVDLDIGSNWSIGGAKALVLYFAGQPGNSATVGDRMWVELEDTSSNTAVAIYDGDPNDVKEEPWHEWAIDMGIFDACGVSLSNIDKVHIGFGGVQGKPAGAKNPSQGGTGSVYFDDIEVWPPYCRTELVTADITGDCVTDNWDLDVVADDWLLYDYNFIAAEPCEANLIGWWKLDEGSGTLTVDSSIYGNDGNIIEASWTTGHPGDPCDSALDFDGDGVVTEEYVVCALRDGNGPGTYPAELMPDKFTVSCWTKLDSFAYFGSFVGNGMDEGSNECGFFFYNWGWIGPEGQDFGLAIRTEAGMSYVETEPIYETKTWYHLAATYDGNYASVYVDGLLAAGPTDVGGPIRWISSSSGNHPENFVIGAWLDPGYRLFVNGVIDEVRYYNLPLSQGDIAVLAGWVTPGEWVYQPVPSLANITDPELKLSRKVNFMDYAVLADEWLEGPILWPSP